MLSGDGLQRQLDRQARRISPAPKRTVTDGPFAETKELIAGYWVWKVKSMDEAVEWVKRCPNPHNDDSEIEIRPLFEMEDFGASSPRGAGRKSGCASRSPRSSRATVSAGPARGPLLSRTGA